MNEKNLENINQIDMSFSGYEEDDNASFGSISEDIEDKRSPVKTGIILNFNDEDDLDINIKKHPSNKPVSIMNAADNNNPIINSETFNGYNEIDMECKHGDDTEDDESFSTPVKKKSLFSADEDINDQDDTANKGLILDEESTGMFNSKKVTVTNLEDDFWEQLTKKYTEEFDNEEKELVETNKKRKEQKGNLQNQLRDLQKKHAKSNKKGAMGMDFHLIGNIEKEHSFFDSAMGNPDGTSSVINSTSDGGLISTGTSSGSGEASSGSMGENLNPKNYSKVLYEVFDTIGFDVIRDKNGILTAKDLYSDNNIIKADNLDDLIYALQPFIEICVILPLSAHTGKKFNSYKDWCDWFSKENVEKYSKYAGEITYCDLLANHLNECEI